MACHINDLPEEALEQVLKYLDGKTILEASVLCSKWNRVISTSREIMKKLRLMGDMMKWFGYLPVACQHQRLQEMLALKRNYNTMRFTGLGGFGQRVIAKVAERFGSKLLVLTIENTMIDDNLLELLKQTPELTDLTVYISNGRPSFQILPPERITDPLVTLPKLKKLDVTDVNCGFLQFIGAPELTHLKCTRNDFRCIPSGIERFLKGSPKLKSLTMDIRIFSYIEPGFPFKLKKLENGTEPLCIDARIIDFLMSQADTVESITMKHCYKTEVFELVLTNFKKLKKFNGDLRFLQPSREFYECLSPLLLEEIEACCGFSCEHVARAVLKNCPNLKSLNAIEDLKLPNQIHLMAEYNKKLEYLAIRSVNIGTAKFQHLKTLHVRDLGPEVDLFDFLAENPIENLDIKRLDPEEYCTKDMMALLNNTSLKYVKLHGEYSCDGFSWIEKDYEVTKRDFTASDGSVISDFQFKSSKNYCESSDDWDEW